ncbi:uncharacterized protein LOC125011790 isoform X2 [Mugil cephalus]|uniref:uncharacterized protein LOC125011790 isoform X2 n=1 Tax=Mugil cephalus TaxID=48193 RepID=UPI001FB7AE03|nr:uncharacterized protein LOC125011790 isoform X2 [Mugil cephalus]XP_047447122.1 uncharacterized protein LOC125011790 isoform X2 [Mugil cephalus]
MPSHNGEPCLTRNKPASYFHKSFSTGTKIQGVCFCVWTSDKTRRSKTELWSHSTAEKAFGDDAAGSGVERHMMSTVIFKVISGFHINLGSAAITKIFEGESDHLIPSVSEQLLSKNMFGVAGRMVGHSFLHHGPCFPGLSPAVIHILFGGSLESTPVTIRDCPDLDIRDAVKMLDGEGELKECDSIHQLCLSWNLPAPNATNRKWLSEKLLLHAVIGQTTRQINQFRKGLQDTELWPLLIHRKDVIPILFPKESEAQVTPQMILDCITWPSSITVMLERSYRSVEEEESDVWDVCRVSGYLKSFIESASQAELKNLIKFWTGWEVPAAEMKVEIVEATLPTALTCFEKLRLPRHYTAFKTFQRDLCACILHHYSFGSD